MRIWILSALATLSLQALAPSAFAKEASGAYLAARQARYEYDFEAAARYFVQALAQDSENQAILEQSIVSLLSLGDVARALPVAQRMDADNMPSQAGHMVMFADLAAREDFAAILKRLEDKKGIGELGDGLVKAWAQLGTGDMTSATATFDAVAKEPGLRDFALYHKALALASVGDFEGAVKIFSGEAEGPIQATRHGVFAWAQALSQLGRQDEALEVVTSTFGSMTGPEVAALIEQLKSPDPVPFTVVRSAREGIAEVFYSIGQALTDGSGLDYVLLFSRAAEHIDPNHTDAVLLSAQVLEELKRHELATKAYQKIPRDNPSFLTAELGRAEALNNDDKTDAAIEVLQQLSSAYPDSAQVMMSMADLYRQHERFAAAIEAYDAALKLYKSEDDIPWFAYYARGISHEREGHWTESEADFRKALALNPDQPQVLNYLGYSLIEKKVKLDEALEMIKRAVELEPSSGYIIDSLGWAYYRLGRYDEAAKSLERAAELVPVDAVVSDHLGDALWMVGRKTEAHFQWRRALSFVDAEKTNSDADPERIRRKLDVGLDVVLEEEKADKEEKTNKKESVADDN